jgi:hypothetical protein
MGRDRRYRRTWVAAPCLDGRLTPAGEPDIRNRLESGEEVCLHTLVADPCRILRASGAVLHRLIRAQGRSRRLPVSGVAHHRQQLVETPFLHRLVYGRRPSRDRRSIPSFCRLASHCPRALHRSPSLAGGQLPSFPVRGGCSRLRRKARAATFHRMFRGSLPSRRHSPRSDSLAAVNGP